MVDSFRTCCPLCHAPDCARFLGYYYRQVIDEDGRYYPDFPVPRFSCRGKGEHTNVNHKTFSLLHYHLIPYSKYSLPFVVKVLKLRHIDRMTVESLQAYLGDISSTRDGYKELSASGIFSFKQLLLTAINKILISDCYPQLPRKLGVSGDETVVIKIFLEFCLQFVSRKHSYPIRGPCVLSYDFYINGGFYLKNAYFLFGTPSQFRLGKGRGQR